MNTCNRREGSCWRESSSLRWASARAWLRHTCSPSRGFCSKEFHKTVKDYHLPPIYQLRGRYHVSIRHGKKSSPVWILAPRLRSRLLRLARQGSCDQLRDDPRAELRCRERAHNGLRWFHSDARGRVPLELLVIELSPIGPQSLEKAEDSSMLLVLHQSQSLLSLTTLSSTHQRSRGADARDAQEARAFSDLTNSSDRTKPLFTHYA
jgi:hypothetical protein